MPSGRLVRGGLAVVTAACLAAAAACGLDLRGLEQSPGDAGPNLDGSVGPTDATVGSTDGEGDDATGLGDADAADGKGAAEVGVPDAHEDARPDAPDAAPDACVPAGPENCTNGVDDDCNGLIDCANPACAASGFVCATGVPAGWTLVAYAESSRPSCPGGWGSSAPTVEGPDGGTACACTCGSLGGNPCVQGTLSMSLGQNVCACGAVQNVPLVSDGHCDPIGHAIGKPCGDWGDGKVAALAPTAVACSETRTLPPITYAAQGETCLPLGAAGGGCSGGGSCLPAPAPAVACIEQAGVVACPAGFTKQAVAFSPGDVADGRQCDPCGCASAATSCTGAVLTLYNDPACTNPGVAIAADGGCNDITGDPSDAGWFTYAATPNTTACAGPATSAIGGGLAPSNPKTICCP